jgi:hypothetical protein
MDSRLEADQLPRVPRICPRCRRALPARMFPQKRGRHHEGYCLECLAQKRASYKQRYHTITDSSASQNALQSAGPILVEPGAMTAICLECGQSAPVQAFPRLRNGFHTQPCRACRRVPPTHSETQMSYTSPSLWSGKSEAVLKRCVGCGELLPIYAFPMNRDGKATGRRCQQCKNRLAYEKRLGDPEVARQAHHRHLVRTYGMTLEQYEEAFAAQEGLCAVCHRPETAVHGINCDRCQDSRPFDAGKSATSP